MPPNKPANSVRYEDVTALIKNVGDENKIVTISAARALVRVAVLQEPSVRDQIIRGVTGKLSGYREEDIFGVSFLPDEPDQRDIFSILSSSEDQEKQRASRVANQIEQKLRAEYPQLANDGIGLTAIDSILGSIALPDFSTFTKLFQSALPVKPELATDLITSVFAKLAADEIDYSSAWRLISPMKVGRLVNQLGSEFNPDLLSLFDIYQAFFKHSTLAHFDMLAQLKINEFDVSWKPPPSPAVILPIAPGLVASREIEWLVSRIGLRHSVHVLNQPLGSSNILDRWGAAQLIESAARYVNAPDYPSLPGGAGPPDPPTKQLYLYFGGMFTTEAEPKRYVDLTLYNGHFYPGDLLLDRLDGSLPLVTGQQYTLEVAIRFQRTGIDPDKEPPHPVKNPRTDKETLTVYVLAQAPCSAVQIQESFASIAWPYDADSESALFRISVPAAPQVGIFKGIIEVRLFDSSLDLLDIVSLSVGVVSGVDVNSEGVPRQSLSWPDIAWDPTLSVENKLPRELSIDVGFDKESSKYRLIFKFAGGKNVVTIPGSSNISQGDIENFLETVRDFWSELVTTNYAEKLIVTEATFSKRLTELKKLGIKAWSMLFGTRYASQVGASETIARLLAKLELKEGSIIQITDNKVGNFVFPWNIVYPKHLKTDPVDPLQFWGARYQIEQVTGSAREDYLAQKPIDLVFALDPGFVNAESQRSMFDSYKERARGRLNVTDPISNQEILFGRLGQMPPAHIYYFYGHGYVPAGGVLRRDTVKPLRQNLDKMPESSATRKLYEMLIEKLATNRNEAWIYIGDSQITESALREEEFFRRQRRPIVFLNICQSAELLPSLTSGLVRVFLDKSASAVVGTECPMTPIFAHAFSKECFDQLFSGCNVGKALWKARRHFLASENRNPLGLAYSLYGRAVANLGVASVLDANEPQPIEPDKN